MINCIRSATVVLVAAIFSGLMTGCASVNDQGLKALQRGDFATAERLFTSAFQQGEPVGANNLGVVYERTGKAERAREAYRLAARYGVPIAQQNLMRLGEAVPAADLAVRRQEESFGLAEALLLGLQGYQQGAAAAQQNSLTRTTVQPFKCVSKKNSFGTVETVCN